MTLSRPEARNAWGQDFAEGIAQYCTAMEDDDDIRCAVMTGDDAGGAFSAARYFMGSATNFSRHRAEQK